VQCQLKTFFEQLRELISSGTPSNYRQDRQLQDMGIVRMRNIAPEIPPDANIFEAVSAHMRMSGAAISATILTA